MTKSARQIAADWRQCPTLRPAIESQIHADNRGEEFTHDRDGNLIARLTNGDWSRICNSGGGAFNPASLRREQPEWEEACRIVGRSEPLPRTNPETRKAA